MARIAAWRQTVVGHRTLLGIAALEVVLVVLGLAVYRVTRSVPPIATTTTFPTAGRAIDPPGTLPWPSQGQGALAVSGLGTVASFGPAAQAVPIASTAKLMTALLIIERHPLVPGAAGPTITVSRTDVDEYGLAIQQDQSVLQVQEGEQLTELQLLQGLLIPSANNFANILARWDAGSLAAFTTEMNARASALGMAQTHFDDASGFSAKTVSTAADLLQLGQAVMASSVLAGIVAVQEATIPVAGVVHTTNALLGQPGVTGIKTGNTDEAGGCLLFSATVGPVRQPSAVIGVVLGEKDLGETFKTASALIAAAPSWLTTTHVVASGAEVGSLVGADGASTSVVAAKDLEVAGWAGDRLDVSVQMAQPGHSVRAGQKVGTLTVTSRGRSTSVDLLAASGIAAPSLKWRLLRR